MTQKHVNVCLINTKREINNSIEFLNSKHVLALAEFHLNNYIHIYVAYAYKTELYVTQKIFSDICK